MKLINYDTNYQYFTSYYKTHPVLEGYHGYPNLMEISAQRSRDSKETMELREALRHDLDLDGLLKGKSKKEIEDLITKNMPEKRPDWVLVLHWDSVSRGLSSSDAMKREVARGLWESTKGYYDKVPFLQKTHCRL